MQPLTHSAPSLCLLSLFHVPLCADTLIVATSYLPFNIFLPSGGYPSPPYALAPPPLPSLVTFTPTTTRWCHHPNWRTTTNPHCLMASPGSRFMVLVMESSMKVYLMMVLSLGAMVSIAEEKFKWEAIRGWSCCWTGFNSRGLSWTAAIDFLTSAMVPEFSMLAREERTKMMSMWVGIEMMPECMDRNDTVCVATANDLRGSTTLEGKRWCDKSGLWVGGVGSTTR